MNNQWNLKLPHKLLFFCVDQKSQMVCTIGQIWHGKNILKHLTERIGVMLIGWFFTNCTFIVSIINPRCLPLQDISFNLGPYGKMIFFFQILEINWIQMVHNSHWIVSFIFCGSEFPGHCLTIGIWINRFFLFLKAQSCWNTNLHK
jgi:hypothetical protein